MKIVVLLCVLFRTATVADIQNQYIGCYQTISTSNAVLPNNNDMTIEWCITQCKQRNSTFAALKNGTGCICGNELKNSTTSENCRVACGGNQSQYCGGQTTFAVYSVCQFAFYGPNCTDTCHCRNQMPCDIQTGNCSNGCDDSWNGSTCNTLTKSKYNINLQYIGCYIDSGERDLPYYAYGNDYFYNDNTNTLESCLLICVNRGYIYAGAQYYWQCFCGNSYGRFGQASPLDCNTPCAGNSSESCGGPYRNTITSIICSNGTYGMGCSETCHCVNNNKCSANGTCPSAGSCADGWKGNTCNERNCSDHNGDCGTDEICVRVDLGYALVSHCECSTGFRRDNLWGSCIDINECVESNPCGSLTANCTNTIGSFFCPDFGGGTTHSTTLIYSTVNHCTCLVNASTCTSCCPAQGPRTQDSGVQEITGIVVLAVLLGISIIIHVAVIIYVLRNCTKISQIKEGKFENSGNEGIKMQHVPQPTNTYESANSNPTETNLYTNIKSDDGDNTDNLYQAIEDRSNNELWPDKQQGQN